MWYNKIMIGLLRSPLHMLVSKSMIVLTYTGRKSGKTFSLPVNYLMDGNLLYCASQTNRVWWRNLRDGRPVQIRLQGKEISGTPSVIEDQVGVEAMFKRYFELSPNLARYFQVELDSNGKPTPASLKACAQNRVMITFVTKK